MRSLAIGNPADGRYALELARETRRLHRGVERRGDRRGDPLGRPAEGIHTETAGGVTLAAAAADRRRGVIRDGDEVVALVTGNGLKTPDALTLGRARRNRNGRRSPGSRPILPPASSAFERLARRGRA